MSVPLSAPAATLPASLLTAAAAAPLRPTCAGECSVWLAWRRSSIASTAGACHTDCKYESVVSACCSESRGTANSVASVTQRTVVSWHSPSIASCPIWSPAPSVRSRARSPVDAVNSAASVPLDTM